MEKEASLPKPQTDLPIPEKEITAHAGGNMGKKFPFPKYIFLGIVFIVLLLIAGATVLGGKYYLDQQKLKSINDFESCAAAGNPIQESYPATCKTPDGRSFTQELSEEEQKNLNLQSSTADWKTYKSSSEVTNCVPILDDWDSFPCKTGVVPAFLIKYPSNWKIDTSVFYDETGKKIAEFSPGTFDLPKNRKCFDKPYVSERGGKIVSEEEISFGDYNGVKRIFETYYEGDGNGIWYPNSYCLENGLRAFQMNFYERSLNSEDRKLFEQIISTFKFID